MREDHTVFGDVEEVVEEMLLPGWGVGGLETPETAIQEVHVQEGYLGPGCEGWGEAEGCWKAISTYILEGLGSQWSAEVLLTLIPPSRTDAQVFTILRLGYFSVLVMRLGDGVVCLTSTFSD